MSTAFNARVVLRVELTSRNAGGGLFGRGRLGVPNSIFGGDRVSGGDPGELAKVLAVDGTTVLIVVLDDRIGTTRCQCRRHDEQSSDSTPSESKRCHGVVVVTEGGRSRQKK
jgi:hypothetical protein